MALTQAQREMGEELVRQYVTDQLALGNSAPIVALVLDMTNAQRKAALLPYATAKHDGIAAQQAALPAIRAAEDANLATDLGTAQALVDLTT